MSEPEQTSACEFCKGPIDGGFYHVMNRLACETCASQVQEQLRRMNSSPQGIARGAAGATLVAIACGIGWAAITRATGTEWGIVADVIGIATGNAALRASGGQRGRAMQAVAVATAVLGIVTGKLALLIWSIVEVLRNEGSSVTAGAVFERIMRVFEVAPGLIVGGFDLVWIGISVFSAWRICRAVVVPIDGPFGGVAPGAQDAPPRCRAIAVSAGPSEAGDVRLLRPQDGHFDDHQHDRVLDGVSRLAGGRWVRAADPGA
ncbi:MAG: hypothetical protein ACREJC_13275 [Tepidisphaeraceae bacterium]